MGQWQWCEKSQKKTKGKKKMKSAENIFEWHASIDQLKFRGLFSNIFSHWFDMSEVDGSKLIKVWACGSWEAELCVWEKVYFRMKAR